jgi:hypothetical protein
MDRPGPSYELASYFISNTSLNFLRPLGDEILLVDESLLSNLVNEIYPCG